MYSFNNNDFSDILFGRKSIRIYDETVKISQGELLQIIEEATTAPSSVNLQPWRFVVVHSVEGKEKLRPLVSFNARQNDTSAAMILIFGDLSCYELAEEIYHQAVAENKMSEEVRDKQLASIVPMYQNLSKEKMTNIVKIDASLAAMQLMLVARAHGYDTNAIGGFDADNLATCFGLDKERFVPVMILSIGKAAETGYDSVRLPVKKIVEFK